MITIKEIEIDCDINTEVGFLLIEKMPFNNEALEILITDGRNTYQCSIHESQVRFPAQTNGVITQETDSKIQWLIEGICNHSNYISLHVSKSQHQTADQPELSAELKHSSVVVRVIWKGVFRLKQTNNFQFMRCIVHDVIETKRELEGLRDSNDKLVKDVSIWKDTAERLQEKHWEKERDELMSNFLVLLNQVKSQMRNVKSELDQQKMMNQSLQDKLKRLSKAREQVVDHVDEHDLEIFDPDEVALLAAGKRVRTTDTSVKNYEVSVNNVNHTEDVSMYARRNPLSGALEYFDVETSETKKDST